MNTCVVKKTGFSVGKRIIPLVWLLSALVGGSARGASWDWTAAGFDHAWSTSDYWSPAGPPDNNGTANILFKASTTTTSQVDTAWSLNSLTFHTSAGSYNFGGSQITLSAGITNNAARTQTVHNDVALAADQTWSVVSGGKIILDGILKNAFALAKAGAGTLELDGANTFSGGLTLDAGTVSIGHNSALGSGDFCINGGTVQAVGAARTVANTLSLCGDFTVSGSLDLTFGGTASLGGNRVITVNNSGVTTFSGAIGDSGQTRGITKNGSGTLALAGANTYSGAQVVNAGILRLDAAGALGSVSAVTLNSGGTLLFNTGGSKVNTSAGLTLNGGTLSVNSYSQTFGTLTLAASSTIDLGSGGAAATLRFSGGTRTGGTLTINNWSGTAGPAGGGTDDQIFFDADPGSSFLSNVQFTGFGSGAELLAGTGELVPVPEPGMFQLMLVGVGILCARQCRRKPRR